MQAVGKLADRTPASAYLILRRQFLPRDAVHSAAYAVVRWLVVMGDSLSKKTIRFDSVQPTSRNHVI